jgi:NAD(P)-dependent dehydrogenase (short-subunit alcohol dehydrogenase family)
MTQVHYNYTGCVTVVTGGANGIGADFVALMRGYGSRVIVWDLERCRPQGGSDDFVAVDVTDLASVDSAMAQTLARAGQVDFLMNSAGIAGPTQSVQDSDPLVWARVVQVNLLGVYHACRAVLPAMRARNQGRIVNIASLAGKEGTPNASAYSASKAGVIALTKSLGKELAETGIRVHALAPAAIETELLSQMSAQHVQIMIDKSPMKRLGTVREVSHQAAWLCSDACTFSTGATVDLSGGRATY